MDAQAIAIEELMRSVVAEVIGVPGPFRLVVVRRERRTYLRWRLSGHTNKDVAEAQIIKTVAKMSSVELKQYYRQTLERVAMLNEMYGLVRRLRETFNTLPDQLVVNEMLNASPGLRQSPLFKFLLTTR